MSVYRYALYFAPEEGTALAAMGWRWLGRYPESDQLVDLPDVGLDAVWQADLVREARGYGFHATLKAPFRPAHADTGPDLIAGLERFAAARRPFTEPAARLTDLHGFLALRPAVPSQALSDLAAAAVMVFDRHRAPASEAELERRLRSPLTPVQRDNLDRWGYPYVLDEFRFHMTLTRRLAGDERDRVMPILEQQFADSLAEPLQFRSICLYQQASAGQPFVLARRFPFSGCTG